MDKLQLTASDMQTVRYWQWLCDTLAKYELLDSVGELTEIDRSDYKKQTAALENLPLWVIIGDICNQHKLDKYADWELVYNAMLSVLPDAYRDTETIQYKILQDELLCIELAYNPLSVLDNMIRLYNINELHPYGRTGYGLQRTAAVLALRDDEPVRCVCTILDALLFQYKLYIAAGNPAPDFDFVGLCDLLKQRESEFVAKYREPQQAGTEKPQPQQIASTIDMQPLELDEIEHQRLCDLYKYCDAWETDAHSTHAIFADNVTVDSFVAAVCRCDLSQIYYTDAHCTKPSANFRCILAVIYTQILANHTEYDAYGYAVQSIGTTKSRCTGANACDYIQRIREYTRRGDWGYYKAAQIAQKLQKR